MKNPRSFIGQFGFLPALVLFLISCNKEAVNPSLKESNHFIAKEGRLVFDNLNQFLSISDSLSLLTEDEYVSFLNRFPDFNSYKRAFWTREEEISKAGTKKEMISMINSSKSILVLTSDSSINEIFGSPTMSYAVDVRGQVVIGDSVGFLSSDNFIMLHKDDVEKYDDVASLSKRGLDSKFARILNFYKMPSEDTASDGDMPTVSKLGTVVNQDLSIPYANLGNNHVLPVPEYGTITFYERTLNNGSRRINVRFYMGSVSSFQYQVMLTTKTQKRTLGVWFSDKTKHHFDLRNVTTGQPDGYVYREDVNTVNWIFGIVTQFSFPPHAFGVQAKIWSDTVPESLGLNGLTQG